MIFSEIFSAGFVLAKRAPIIHDFSKIKWMFLRGFLTVLGTSFLYKAFETNLSISASFGLLSSPLVFGVSLFSAWLLPSWLEKRKPEYLSN